MATANDIIQGALRLLQVASDDVVLTASEANDALEALNQMIDSWSNEALLVNHITMESFTLTAGHNPHTIGTGGDLNTVRPIELDSATVQVAGIDYPIQIMGYDDYAVIKLKTLTNTFPQFAYLDPIYPTANLYLYPVPSTNSLLKLYSLKPFTKFVNLTDVITLPPGYERAMKYNLALEIASEYQTTAGNDVIQLALGSRANLKRVNARPVTLDMEPALLSTKSRRFNIYRGF
jgi:hypothetical protein